MLMYTRSFYLGTECSVLFSVCVCVFFFCQSVPIMFRMCEYSPSVLLRRETPSMLLVVLAPLKPNDAY